MHIVLLLMRLGRITQGIQYDMIHHEHLYCCSLVNHFFLYDRGIHDRRRAVEAWLPYTGIAFPDTAQHRARGVCAYYLLVFGWSYFNAIAEKCRAHLDRGGRMMVPLPDVRLILQPGAATPI